MTTKITKSNKPINETKEFLRKAYFLDKRLEDKELELAQLEERIKSIKSFEVTERLQTSVQNDKIGELVAKKIDLEDLVKSQMIKLLVIKKDISELINGEENEKYKRLLELRYIHYESWEDIAIKMNYTINHVHKVHNKALISLTNKKVDSK